MKNWIFILALLVGCSGIFSDLLYTGSTYYVNVDAYGDDTHLQQKDCYLMAMDSCINTKGFQYQEFMSYINQVMEAKGYHVVDSIDSANVLVLFNYGISEPNTYSYNKTIPIWGNTGISSASTTGDIKFNSTNNSIDYSQRTSYRNSTGVTGYQTITKTRTDYLKYINFVAYDLDYFVEHHEEKRIWQTLITNNNSINDLRRVFPHMLIAGYNYLGKSSLENKRITITDNDSRVKELRGETTKKDHENPTIQKQRVSDTWFEI